ncbi:MAG: hypothetical protein PHV74_03830 [Dehalococcoidia bacterium]|nr:hypothetical protein [Dehalococcoidia bacterium]
MAIWISSDWHCDPEGLRPGVVEWITLGKQGKHRLIGDGDMFNILPLGKKKWQQAAACKQLGELLGDYPFDYVAGNHDPYGVMVELMKPYPNIKVYKNQLEVEEGGRKYYITHGHRWSIDWGFLGLKHIAPPVVEFLVNTPLLRDLWYRICRWRGWMASDLKKASPVSGKEQDKINKFIRIIWGGADKHALENNCCVIIGHTHTSGIHRRGVSRSLPSQAYMMDDGDIQVDGSYVEITKDAELQWLPSSATPAGGAEPPAE